MQEVQRPVLFRKTGDSERKTSSQRGVQRQEIFLPFHVSWAAFLYLFVLISCSLCLSLVCICRVPVPFQSDRVNLKANPKWQNNAQNNNLRIVWADSVLKINRKDGKVNCISVLFYVCSLLQTNLSRPELRFPLASPESSFTLCPFKQFVLYVKVPSTDIRPAFCYDSQTISTRWTRLKNWALCNSCVTIQITSKHWDNCCVTCLEIRRVVRYRVPDCSLG